MKHLPIRHRLACLAMLFSLQGVATAEDSLFNIRQMTPETALKAAQAALKDCRDRGFQVSVAVTDRQGVLQVLLRDRFAGTHTIAFARDKAWTSASFKITTADLAEETQAGKASSGIRALSGVAAVGGGVPIEAGGNWVGAIGVSGAPGGEADEQCARAGIDAVADDLAF